MSDKFKTVIIARFQAIPTEQIVVYKWPKWLMELPIKDQEEVPPKPEQSQSDPPIVTLLRDGISLLKLPEQVAVSGLKCVDAFRYWRHAGGKSQATVRFMFVNDPLDSNMSHEIFFDAFCKRRLFMKGKIYDHGVGIPTTLALDVPYKPFNSSKVKSPHFAWWMTIENGRFIPKKR